MFFVSINITSFHFSPSRIFLWLLSCKSCSSALLVSGLS